MNLTALTLALIVCSGLSSATREDAVIEDVLHPLNITSGDSFTVVVRLKYPCRKEVRFYLDDRFYGIRHTVCKLHETSFEFSNSDPRINYLQPGWHDIRIEVYDSRVEVFPKRERISFSDVRFRVVPRVKPSSTTTVAQPPSTATSSTSTILTTSTTPDMPTSSITSTTSVSTTESTQMTVKVNFIFRPEETADEPGKSVYPLIAALVFVFVAGTALYIRMAGQRKGR
jgi:hypothetical protein